VTVRDRLHFIMRLLQEDPERQLTFYDLVVFPATRIMVIMTFLAVLELIRRRRIVVVQEGAGGSITIRRGPGWDGAGEPSMS
jgi:chromatin segregation and condensation protein Rec8/ScpA/Scc1 (kleisin family)